jgi:hypothetical protein
VVFTLPAEIARIAYWNKRAVYGQLFKAMRAVTCPCVWPAGMRS